MGLKNIVYLSLSLGMLIYAVPRLEMGQGLTLPTIFAVVWLGMALLIVAAHLHAMLGVDDETRRELKNIQAYRRWRMARIIQDKAKMLHARE